MANIVLKLKEKTKANIKLYGWSSILIKTAMYLVVLISVANLAFSQVHIGVIIHIFNRIIGLVMFAFILFGLVSLFTVTRLTGARNTIVRAILSLSLTISAGVYYIILLLKDMAAQESVSYFTIYDSFMTSVVMLVGYLIALVLFAVGEFIYGSK